MGNASQRMVLEVGVEDGQCLSENGSGGRC